MRDRPFHGAFGLALLLCARFAAADAPISAPPPSGPPGAPGAYPPPSAPVYNIYVLSPPPPVVAPTDHLHEGFLLRMSLGFGYFHDHAKIEPAAAGTEATISAAGLAAEINLGGSVSQSLVLGGTLL